MCVLRKERGVLGRGLVAAAGVSVCSGGSIHSCCNGELLFLSLSCVCLCVRVGYVGICVCVYIYIYICMYVRLCQYVRCVFV